jgi:outer membrane protein TolC
MGRKAVVMGLALVLVATVGCKQQCFLPEPDLDEFHHSAGLPLNAVNDPTLGVAPLIPPVGPPPTPSDPDRQPWYMTLNEAVAIALERGTTGVESVRFATPTTLPVNDDLVAFNGTGVSGEDGIRVFAFVPAIEQASIEFALGRFDPQFVTSMNWTTTDQPVQGLTSFQNGQAATFLTGLVKPLPTGGVAGITFQTQYQNLTRPPTGFTLVNPAYTTQLQVGFEQPLWRDYGVEINQVISALSPPAGLGISGQLAAAVNGRRPGVPGTAVEGILLSRIRFDQSRADFERHVSYLLVNTETAYWALYGSYVDLYAKEQALRQAYETWRISKAKYEAGQINITSFAQTRGQYEKFRGDRLQSLDTVLENERALRAQLGLPIEDGKRIVPVDTPTVAPYKPDWEAALRDTMELRPELVLAREDLKAKQLAIIAQLNFLKPDLRSFANYSINGLGDRLDGNGSRVDGTGTVRSDNALRDLASDHFTSWTAGLQLTIPLGYRQEHAALRQARLALAQSYWTLKNQELRAQRALAAAYRELDANYQIIGARRASRIAYAEELEGRFKEFIAGKAFQAAGAGNTIVDFLLQAQTDWTTALSTEYASISAYNIALARFEFARGTMLKHDSVNIQEGPLPRCAQVRAVEHEQERAKAILLREREGMVPYQNCSAEHGKPAMPLLPAVGAPSIPALMSGSPEAPTEPLPLPSAPEQGPGPERIPSRPTPVPGAGQEKGTPAAPTPTPDAAATTPGAMPTTLRGHEIDSRPTQNRGHATQPPAPTVPSTPTGSLQPQETVPWTAPAGNTTFDPIELPRP